MSTPQLMAYKDTEGAEFVCFDCPLPECHEGSPGCLYQEAKKKRARRGTRWATLVKEVKGLRPGQFLIKHLTLEEIRSAQSSIAWYARQGTFPGTIKTWRIKQDNQTGLLNILRKGE